MWCIMTILSVCKIYTHKCQECINISPLTWSLWSSSLISCFAHFLPHTLSFHHILPAVQAEFVLLGQRHHGGWLRVSGGHGLPESTEEAAGGGEAGPGDGQTHGQDAGGGGETEPQEVTSGRPGQYQNYTVMTVKFDSNKHKFSPTKEGKTWLIFCMTPVLFDITKFLELGRPRTRVIWFHTDVLGMQTRRK